MTSVATADRILGDQVPLPSAEEVPLGQALGRVLARPVTADRDGPPYDRVAMDGWAVDTSEGGTAWTLRGLQVAGHPPLTREGTLTCVEVATGAVLPLGCDAVIPYEDAEVQDGRVVLREGLTPPGPGRHVHQGGTDYREGDTLLPAGTLVRSPHLHVLASVGYDPVAVVRRARWALAATGDELVEVTARPEAWQIRRSNAAAITGEAAAWGLVPGAQTVLADEGSAVRRGLESLLPGLDALVITGGVSAGVLDLVPGVLADLGAEVLFHKLAQRPGKPLWCGTLPSPTGGRTLVFGLPGNPVSSLFSFRRYVLPWLLAFEGRPLVEHRVSVPGLKAPPRGQTVFLPWSDTGGVLTWRGSGDFLALAASSGFLELDDDPRSLVEPRYHPWGGHP